MEVDTTLGFGTVLGFECYTRFPSEQERDYRVETSLKEVKGVHRSTHRIVVKLDKPSAFLNNNIGYFALHHITTKTPEDLVLLQSGEIK